MRTEIFIYILAALAILQGLLTLLDGIRAARHMKTFRPKSGCRQRVLVFCPCKGVEVEFEKNIRSILEQDYPDYEVRFIVESEEDAALKMLQAAGAGNVVVAGRASTRGQKVHNLAYAVEHNNTPASIYVFCDSDARFPRNWLSRLTAPLGENNVTTGYRWYVVDRVRLPSLLRSAWNAASVSILGDHRRNFAWGGSMAMRRETFERLNILESWRGALSDDYAVTRSAQKAGAKVVFVPECLIPTHGECSWRELFEFTTRQVLITRVYRPGLWRIGFLGHVIFTAAFLILLFTEPALWLIVYVLSAAKAWIRYDAVRSVLSGAGAPGYGWFYILCSPLVAFLYLYNMIRSSLGRDIVWKRVRYRLVSPTETRVFWE